MAIARHIVRFAILNISMLLLQLMMWQPLSASEPVPFLDITYQQGPDSGLPDYLLPWWQTSIQEADEWCMHTLHVSGHGGEFLSHLKRCHLLGGGIAQESGTSPTVSCSWRGDALPQELSRFIDSLPGHVRGDDHGDHSLRGPGYAIPASLDPIPDGLRVVLDGRGIAMDAEDSIWVSTLGMPRDTLKLLGQSISTWKLECAVEGDGHGWIDSGLPREWFKAIDIESVKCIPEEAVAGGAIGIDGAAVAGAIERKFGKDIPYDGFMGIPSGFNLLSIARALDGTWDWCFLHDGSWCLRAPRGKALDDFLQAFFQEYQLPLPDEGGYARVGDLYCAKHVQEWLWSDRLETLNAWAPTPSTTLTSQIKSSQSSLWIFAGADAATSWIDKILGPVAAVQCALPCSLCSLPIDLEFAASLTDCHGKAWPDFIAAMATMSNLELVGRIGGKTLTIDSSKGLLPWVAPGMAIRWFVDYFQANAGQRKLVKAISTLHAMGESALTTGASSSALQNKREAGVRLMTTLGVNRKAVRMLAWRQFLKYGASGIGDAQRQEAQAVAAVLPLSSVIDDPTFPTASEIIGMRVQQSGRVVDYLSQEAVATQSLCNGGLTLIAAADRRGLILLNRAERFLRHPQNAAEALCYWDTCANRDFGYLVAEMQQLLNPDEINSWLDQEVRYPLTFWNGERVLTCGALAKYLIGDSRILDYQLIPVLMDSHLMRSHCEWANASRDVAICMLAMQSCESDSSLIPPMLGEVNSLLGEKIARQIIQQEFIYQGAVAQCQFLHIAGMIERLALQGKLPRTFDLLDHQIGPLVIRWGDNSRALSYEPIGERGFHLWMSAKEGPLPEWSPLAWEQMTVKMPGNVTASYVRHRGLNLSIDPTAAHLPDQGP